MADRSSLYQSLCTFDALSVFVLSLLLIATAFTPFSVLYYIFRNDKGGNLSVTAM